MSQEIVRCPYCVLGSEFQPMLRHTKKLFVCPTCGHTSSPRDPYTRCPCSRCVQMNRLKNRISSEHPAVASAANS